MGNLGDLIKLSRAERKTNAGKAWTQDDLAEKAGISKQWISNIERGKTLPSLSLLLNLRDKLVETGDQEAQSPLSLWLFKWLEKQVSDEINLSKKDKEAAHSVIEKAIARSTQPTIRAKTNLQRTLDNFPYAFEPLTIVCGDRREFKPKTRGDIFANSVAITDLTFLPKLGLSENVTIRSDKLFVLMGEDYLRREFGKTNLLIIGSPAVNFAARVINNHSVFRFNLPQWLKEKEVQIRTLKEPEERENPRLSLKELNDQRNLRIFWQLAQQEADTELAARFGALEQGDEKARAELLTRLLDKEDITPADIDHVRELALIVKQLLDGQRAQAIMNQFRIPGLMDPSDATLHAMFLRDDNDFAVISLAPNPFASTPDYVCIMVAGIHGPGTAHALKALADDDFREHPFGGIIEVELDLFNNDWPTRFQQARWKWQTKKYDSNKLLTNLKLALDQPREIRPRMFENLSDDEIKDCIGFVEHTAAGATAHADKHGASRVL